MGCLKAMIDRYNDLSELPYCCATLVELLRHRAQAQPEQTAYIFLQDQETEFLRLTYQQLDAKAKAIAAILESKKLSGERALLLYPPGLDYLVAFFGCLYAGVVAVPAYPPRNQRNTPRIQAVVKDATAAIALCTTTIMSKVQPLLNLAQLQWLTTDIIPDGIEENWQAPLVKTDTLAFLQYTSGSTGTPKGVMLTHGNLMHNAAMTYQLMEHSPSSKFVSWLPVYHDMGLIGGILQPLYGGFPCILMSPASFLQSPYRWLKAISDYGGTTSGAPNFAYDLCVQKITPEQRKTLDLSTWSVAFNGSEPVRSDTLERFYTAFAECGFRGEAFYPCYGMAEATLMVSGVVKEAVPAIKTVRVEGLESDRVVDALIENQNVRSLVSCGQSIPEQQIAIVNPQTLTRCLPDEVGEVWVSGPSIGQGYWQRIAETNQTFHAYISDTGEGPFLRTGDLGFLDNGELFITGRSKDLIIIRGRNLYPQDIELTAYRSHAGLRSHSAAAFAVEVDNEERLVVVQELEFRAKPNVEKITAAIRNAIAQEYEVQVYGVILVKPGSVPKTSSGKIQRLATKAAFLAGELEDIGSSILQSINFAENEPKLQREALLNLTTRESQPLLEAYLIEQVARVLLIAPSQINPQQPLTALGIDSLKVFELKNRIEVDLEVYVSIADFFEDFTLAQLATKLIAQLTTGTSLQPLAKIRNASGKYPLSFQEQQLWLVDRLASNTPAYNIPIAINLAGKLNEKAFAESLNEIIRRHEVLRTSFVVENGQPVVAIAEVVTFTLAVEVLESNARVEHIATEFAKQPFDLSHAPLLRAKLLRLGETEYTLLITLHHIVADGWSIGILIRELAAIYEAFSQEKPSPLPKLPIQYVDFAYWQQQQVQQNIQVLLAYWKQQLKGKLPVLTLKADRARSPVQTFNGAQAKLILPQYLTQALKNLSHQEGATLFMTLLAAFKTLLYRYTGQTDILVGSPIANRNRGEIETLIGCFVNILVLRSDLSGEPSFRELLARVRQIALGAYVHQDLPFEKLVEEIQPERDPSYNPVFQVMFVLQNVPIPDANLSNVSFNYQPGYNGTAKFDLTLFMEEREEELVGTLEYNTDLFEFATIERMLGHFRTLIEGIVVNPERGISDLPLLTADEEYQIIVEWNQTNQEWEKDLQAELFHKQFEAQVERTPDAIAVVFQDRQLTYRQLNQKANQLAHYLQKLGVKPDILVGICVERSIEMLVGLLGILKAGGAYVPLDPTYPKQRLAFMLEEVQAPVLLTQQHLVDSGLDAINLIQNSLVVCLDTDWQKIDQSSLENPVTQVTVDNLAYVIYTSGSTGKPKGTLIEHRGLTNYLNWCSQAYAVEQGEGAIVHSSISFDMTITGLFSPLLVGRRVELLAEGFSIESLAAALRRGSNFSLIKITPAQLELLSQQLSPEAAAGKTRAFIIGGENLSASLLTFWQNAAPETLLVNEYGPTETVVGCCVYWVPLNQHQSGWIPIGRPIANTQLYILDQKLRPVPIGVTGELYIGGAGVARGYLNRPDLTSERFITNPFSEKEGARLYKTGDLARYLPDGTIECLGRIDHGVKIRGFRVELGEIEAVLGQHPAVQEVAIAAREDSPGDRRLVAYIVPRLKEAISVSELRSFLKEKLPEYMIPSAFVTLAAMPLTINGKVDRQALPIPENIRPELAVAYESPQTQVERIIANLWQEVLHLEKVGIYDNFFDLGGHSLLLVQVHNKLEEIWQEDIEIVELFKYPTISSLAKYLSQKHEEQHFLEQSRTRSNKQKAAINQQKQLMKARKLISEIGM
jgi:amino acid adenylation domain-containing protein